MSTASKRKLKLEFAGEIRRTTVQDKSFSYEDLESLVVGTFFVGKYPEKGIEVRYRDDDGDAGRHVCAALLGHQRTRSQS